MMYRIIEGSAAGLTDVESFLEILQRLQQHPAAEVRALFNRDTELVVARAPGRLDVMGGIADYSGSLVLQLPTREATLVALQSARDRMLRIVSLGSEADQRPTRAFEVRLEDFEEDGKPVDYATARAFFERYPQNHWAAYIAGVFLVLMREQSVRFATGARLLIESHVPEGKGVSSSAALEVAVMCAVVAAYGLGLEPREIALLCQKVENLVVGAPCGVMDQMTAVCGKANRLLALLCQPAESRGYVPIPEGIVVAGLDSGVRHAVTGAAYGDVRTGAFMGYRIIAQMAGLRVGAARSDNFVEVGDSRWRGYLANIEPSEFEKFYAAGLPLEMAGAEFLARYGGTTDTVTRVQPEKKYAIRTPTAHPIYEHFRVRAFGELLQGESSEQRFRLLGELMYQSHSSYSACGLGEARTDLLVQLCRKAKPGSGAFGAKITGGGSGGTVAFFGHEAQATLQRIVEDYARETGYAPRVFWGSSPGASDFGTVRLRSAA